MDTGRRGQETSRTIGSSNMDYREEVNSMKIIIDETDSWGVAGLDIHYKFEVITRYLSEDRDIYPPRVSCQI